MTLPRTPSLLIADGDAALRSSVSSFLAARGWSVDEADSGDAAADMLLARPTDVLIVDVATRVRSGIELLELAKRSHPTTRGILVGAAISSGDLASAARLGAVRVMTKPISLLDLADAVTLAADCREGFHGWLHRLSLVDVLQMFHLAGHSLHVTLRGPVEGRLTLSGGEIVHAETGNTIGAEAVVKLLQARHGAIETSPIDSHPVTITKPFDHLILDLRQLDEGRRLTSRPGASSFGDFFLAEAPRESPADVVRRWLDAHAPGAFAWMGDRSTNSLVAIDGTKECAEAVRAVGVAIAMADTAADGWSRVEVVVGDVGVAILRRKDEILVFARAALGTELLRRFRFEVTQLSRFWELSHVA